MTSPEEAPRMSEVSPPTAIAFILDEDSKAVVRQCFIDLGIVDAQIVAGGLTTAIDNLAKGPSPRLLVIDSTDVEDPQLELPRLAAVCDPSTSVIIVGARNDIVLYRGLKAAGIGEYFFKPLVTSLVVHACQELLAGGAVAEGKPLDTRKGKLVFAVGVRGGVGATSIAVSAAWHLAEVQRRRTLLIDLGLENGDAALLAGVQPTHALTEALQYPERVDDLFLERALIRVSERFTLMASLEPLKDSYTPTESGVRQLLDKLRVHHRYILVDLPMTVAMNIIPVLSTGCSILLISDGSLTAARDVRRWNDLIGPNTPDRQVLHVLNKQGARGGLPVEEFAQVAGGDLQVVIPYDRNAAANSILGAEALSRSKIFAGGISRLLNILSGEPLGNKRSFAQRIFASW